ncbi:MAG: molybdopterin-guanine dinucleotide biosynthesis protein B [Myxococcota bacterium]|jgi:molybdopterin-guanine dinucleotide biosynthesis protein MobB|nr:molybdopterin-guanine dinucleotide biosynthesis protein B [Myxococcota bacterium]
MPKALSIVAKSGTGKTTLLEKLIPALKRRGRRVAVIKHDAHRFDIDHPGKDTHRLYQAGADAVLISSAEKLALIRRCEHATPIEQLIETYFPDMELVLTEGYKHGPLPKLEVHRKERSTELLCRGQNRDETLVAVASDEQLALDVPVLELEDIEAIADFVEEWIAR